LSSLVSTAAAICTGAKHGPTRSTVRACRRQVNTTLAATPLRRATSVTFAPGRQRLLDDPRLVILRPATSPLQLAQNLDPHRLMTLKLDLRSHASRKTPRQARRCSSEAYIQNLSGRNDRGREGIRFSAGGYCGDLSRLLRVVDLKSMTMPCSEKDQDSAFMGKYAGYVSLTHFCKKPCRFFSGPGRTAIRPTDRVWLPACVLFVTLDRKHQVPRRSEIEPMEFERQAGSA
jgi:hypothetical protein